MNESTNFLSSDSHGSLHDRETGDEAPSDDSFNTMHFFFLVVSPPPEGPEGDGERGGSDGEGLDAALGTGQAAINGAV